MKASLYVGVAAIALAPSAAFANEPTAPAAAQSSGVPADAEQAAFGEIVVTAQRREQRLQNVPIAITAQSGATLKALQINSTEDLARIVPGLNVTESDGYVLPRIRGVGTSANAAGVENPVAVYIDGVYMASQPGLLTGFHNVERVEVLKGPQGTLFGRNATGGVIQIITKDPSFEFGGNAEVGYANYDTVSGQLYLAGGLTQSVAADVAVLYSKQGDGWGKNIFNGQDVYRTDDNLSVRSKWMFENDLTKVRLALDYNYLDGSSATLGLAPPSLGPSAFGNTYVSRFDVDHNLQTRVKSEGGGASLTINQKIGDLSLTSISAYRKAKFRLAADIDFAPQTFLHGFISQDDKQFTQELQLSGSNDKLDWMIGGFYMDSMAEYLPLRIEFGPGIFPPFGAVNTFGKQKTQSASAFGQATYALAPDTKFTAGLRFTHESKDYSGRMDGELPGNIPVGTLVATNDKLKFDRLTWRLSLDHRFSPELMVYASYNRGFKAGGFNLGAPGVAPYLPETLDAYEVGLKSDLAGGRFSFNAAGFYYKYSNIQVTRYVTGTIQVYNGAKATIYGLDFDAQAKLVDGLTLTLGASLLHARFDEFPNADYWTPMPPFGFALTQQNAKGNRLPLTPVSTGTEDSAKVGI